MWICGCYAEALEACGLAFTLMLRVPQHDNTLSELVPTYNWLYKARDNNNLCLKGFLIPLSRQTYGV